MPHVKVDFISDEELIEVHIRPSASLEDQGAIEQRWGAYRSDGEAVTDGDMKEWTDGPTGLEEHMYPLIRETINALLLDPTHYYIRLLVDYEPDGEPPAMAPEPLQTPRLVAAVQALLSVPGVSYR